MRVRRTSGLAIFVVIAVFLIFSLRSKGISSRQQAPPEPVVQRPIGPPEKPVPAPVANSREHPIDLLVKDNERVVRQMIDRQSKSLQEAVRAYQARYNMDPPPRFEVWYEFAKKNKVQIIDDYDTIHHSLLPFWGLKPQTIRARVQEALGYDPNALLAVLIRNGKVAHHQAGSEWLKKSTLGMMEKFIDLLPDMDLAFNIRDEPRVVVPHDELARLVEDGRAAQAKSMRDTNEVKKNAFSKTPQDLSSGRRVEEFKTTRFNEYTHQPSWLVSRLSCNADTPARATEGEGWAEDNITPYAYGPLKFIYNHTAYTDICYTPSFAESHGFFERPNIFSITHSLIPVFSQSKMSSFQDILIPSAWNWADKVVYEPAKDTSWGSKITKLWWVGSTTGGYSRLSGWRKHHRQIMVKKLNSLDTAQVMINRASIEKTDKKGGSDGENPNWAPRPVERKEYAELVDVHFSGVGQCEAADCKAQKEFFRIVSEKPFQAAWKYKFLLDLDGNAFSGRFHAFLKSKSLPIKMSLFREWHDDWIRPWVHYIPVSLGGDEVLETVRYLAAEEEGRRTAERLAEQGRMWANDVLRKVDYEAWLFRLLLEWVCSNVGMCYD